MWLRTFCVCGCKSLTRSFSHGLQIFIPKTVFLFQILLLMNLETPKYPSLVTISSTLIVGCRWVIGTKTNLCWLCFNLLYLSTIFWPISTVLVWNNNQNFEGAEQLSWIFHETIGSIREGNFLEVFGTNGSFSLQISKTQIQDFRAFSFLREKFLFFQCYLISGQYKVVAEVVSDSKLRFPHWFFGKYIDVQVIINVWIGQHFLEFVDLRNQFLFMNCGQFMEVCQQILANSRRKISF